MHPYLLHSGHLLLPTFGVLAAVGLMSALTLSLRTAVIVAIVLVPRLSHAGARQCERAISFASAKFGRLYYQALRKCNDAVLKGSNPGPCPDARTSTPDHT